MALPTTGEISISMINIEQGNPSNRNVSLGTLRSEWYSKTGHADFSGSGSISMSAWRGKQWSTGTPPTAPTLSESSWTVNNIQITWTSPTWNIQGPPVGIGYRLDVNGNVSNIAYNQNGYTIPVYRGESYSIRILAYNPDGNGPWSNTILRSIPTTVTPTIVYAEATTGSYHIGWSPLPGADYFEVSAMVNGFWTNDETVPGGATGHTGSTPSFKATQVRVRAHFPASGSRPAEFSSYATASV